MVRNHYLFKSQQRHTHEVRWIQIYLLIFVRLCCLVAKENSCKIRGHLSQCSEATYVFLSHLIKTVCRPMCILNTEVPNSDRHQELFYKSKKQSMGRWEKERIKHWTSAETILTVGKVIFPFCFSLFHFKILGHCNKKQWTMQKRRNT